MRIPCKFILQQVEHVGYILQFVATIGGIRAIVNTDQNHVIDISLDDIMLRSHCVDFWDCVRDEMGVERIGGSQSRSQGGS